MAACNAAQKQTDTKDSTASEAAADTKCQAAQYNTPNPTGGATGRTGDPTTPEEQAGADYAAKGDAHAAMLSTSTQLDNPANPKVVNIPQSDIKTATPQELANMSNLGNLTSPDRIKNADVANFGGYQGDWSGGTAVQTTDVPYTQADKNRYDPANVVVGGDGTGMVRCSGSGPACPGGKWAVDKNDGSQVMGMNEALQDKFSTFQMPSGQADQLFTGYQVTSDMPKGTTSAQLETAAMFQSMGESKGMSQDAINIAIGTADRESAFNTANGPNTTSAYGYGQYVGDTWLSSAKTDDGTVLNRNDSFNQASVLLDDTQKRNDAYNNSSLQSSMSAGQYDYAIHHDGSIVNGGAGNSYAINYYNSTASKGQTFANYAQGLVDDGSSGAGTVVASNNKTPTFGSGSSGGGINVSSGGNTGGGSTGGINIGGGSTGGGSIITNAGTNGGSILSMLGLGGATGTGGSSNVLSQLAGAALAQQLMGGSSQSSQGSASSNTSSNSSGSSSSASTSTTPRGYDIALEVAKLCGAGLDTASDADMLKVSTCQQTTLSELTK